MFIIREVFAKMAAILILGVTGVVVVCILVAIRKNLMTLIESTLRRRRLLKKIPRPELLPSHWLLGYIPALYRQDESTVWYSVVEVRAAAPQDRSIIAVDLGLITTVDILHSKHVASLLKEPKAVAVYNLLLPWLGEGLLVAGGKKWFRNRRLLTPAFHYEILKGYFTVYHDCLSILLKKWSNSASSNSPVLLFDTLSAMSLDILLQCAFSFRSHAQVSELKHPYVQATSDLVRLCSDRLMNPLYMIDLIYWLTPHWRRTKKVCRLAHKHAEEIIRKRRQHLEETLNEKSRPDSKYLDFLDVLLMARDEEGQGMSDLEIRNEVDTFMFEGHDTTTSGMSWTLYCLAQHPQHQDKIREEVRSVLMGREWLEYEDLKQLNYTSWCIKEAMRLYPPVPGIFRETKEEVTLGDVIVPQNTTLYINTFAIHHNDSIWNHPDEFNPLRFSSNNLQKHGPYDYIPFSAGNRNCIGQHFAMNEMKVVVGTILNRFLLKVDESHCVEMISRLVLRTKNDIKLMVKPLL